MNGPETVEVALFRVGGIHCGLEISELLEIKKVGAFTPVHHAPACVAGVINLRGQIVTLVDTRKVLGMGPAEKAPFRTVIFVANGSDTVGLIVDSVDDAIAAEKSRIQPVPANMDQEQRRFFQSVYPLGDGLIALLNRERLLCPQQK